MKYYYLHKKHTHIKGEINNSKKGKQFLKWHDKGYKIMENKRHTQKKKEKKKKKRRKIGLIILVNVIRF